jgi:hypothetical protein
LTDLGVSIVAIKGIDILGKELQKHNGEDAVISISHKLYGNQKIKCKLNCIVDDSRIGLYIKNGQEICVYKNDIINFQINQYILFEDDLMSIKIAL